MRSISKFDPVNFCAMTHPNQFQQKLLDQYLDQLPTTPDPSRMIGLIVETPRWNSRAEGLAGLTSIASYAC